MGKPRSCVNPSWGASGGVVSVLDLSLFGQARECEGASPVLDLGRCSGRVPALPYPPPGLLQCTAPAQAIPGRAPW